MILPLESVSQCDIAVAIPSSVVTGHASPHMLICFQLAFIEALPKCITLVLRVCNRELELHLGFVIRGHPEDMLPPAAGGGRSSSVFLSVALWPLSFGVCS